MSGKNRIGNIIFSLVAFGCGGGIFLFYENANQKLNLCAIFELDFLI